MAKQRWENIDDYFTKTEPNLDRSTWVKSNEWGFGSSTFKGNDWPKKKKFDKDKCPVCGGAGRLWVTIEDPRGKRRRIKRSLPCPENCEYTVHW